MYDTTQVPKYSFYLNVVVIDSAAPAATAPLSPASNPPPLSEEQDPPEKESEPAEEQDEKELKKDSFRKLMENPTLNLSNTRKAMWESFKNSSDSLGQKASGLGDSLSKKATAYVASKTMLARASAAIKEIIPMLLEDMDGIDISITNRFQQANVFVLEVDMKGCDMVELVKKTRGEEVAHLYEQVKMGMDLLGTEDAIKTFEMEFLPKARIGLMEKLSSLLLEKLKAKETDLCVECITLEDQEEARWLYTFLEFSQQMKNQSRHG
uniref:Uncharacterized protein n=1 Tax=Helicotheca tamesis TaxID=374047 RepID=A0A7S2HFB1_9STRA